MVYYWRVVDDYKCAFKALCPYICMYICCTIIIHLLCIVIWMDGLMMWAFTT